MISLLCDSAESCLAIQEKESPDLGLSCVVSVDALRQSIGLADRDHNPKSGHRLLVFLDSIDLSFESQIAFALFLKSPILCFELTRDNYLEIMSAVIDQTSKSEETKFVAFCDDLELWTDFALLCGNPGNLQVCPSMAVIDDLWLSVLGMGVRLSESDFVGAGNSLEIRGNIQQKYGFFPRHRLQTVLPESLFSSEDYRNCLFEFLCQSENRASSRRPSLAQDYELALLRLLETRPKAVVGIVGDRSGEILDCAIRAGALRLVLLGNDQGSLAYLKIKCDVACQKNPDLEIVTEMVEDLTIDILVVGVSDSMTNDLAAFDRMGRYRYLLSTSGEIIPSRIALWVTQISSERYWSAAKADDTLCRVSEIALDGSFPMARPSLALQFESTNRETLKRTTEFVIQTDWFVDGIACWMEFEMSPGIIVSTQNTGFPQLFLPFPARMRCRKGEALSVSIARLADKRSVWLEWAAWTTRFCVPIQNAGGNPHRISLD
jgi:hypothetical protein